MKNVLELIGQTFRDWNKDNAAQLAAAIAYYTIFSLSPLIIIALVVAGQFFNGNAARAQLLAQISGFLGQQTASFIGSILDSSALSQGSFVATCISLGVLLVGASGIFGQVQFALNKIWDVPPQLKHNLISLLKIRLRSFLMVLAVGMMLLVFLLISAMASSINASINIGAQYTWLPQAINFIVIFVIFTILCAMIFRIVPDKEITWADVWLGAAITTVLFMIGRYAISLYIYYTKSGSAYGAAGSLIVLLIWIYYSAQIFLLGAEFTHVYAVKFGSHKPSESNAQ